VFWQNRSFNIAVGAFGAGTLNQQHVVTLHNASGSTAASQTATGQCVAGSSYWDIGVRGDTGPGNHASTVTLSPQASILTSIAGYPGGGTGFRANSAGTPSVVSQYCNGSRVPPEFGGLGWQVPPGISDATVPNPIFNLQPAATVDEGNNWVNIAWGPLAETNPTGVTLGNYSPAAGSSVINYVTAGNSATTYAAAPTLDFFNNNRKANSAVDVGAVEFGGGGGGGTAVVNFSAPSPALTTTTANSTVKNGTITVMNSGTAALTLTANPTITQTAGPGTFAIVSGGTCISGTVVAAGGGTCTISVRYTPPAASPTTATAHVTLTDTGAATGTQNGPNFNGN
jgi:hypothetical protein